jgi:hypothetical protein
MYTIEGPEDGGKAPNGPNFGLIVTLFCVTIVIGLGLALLFIPSLARTLHVVHPDRHPTSQLVLEHANRWVG